MQINADDVSERTEQLPQVRLGQRGQVLHQPAHVDLHGPQLSQLRLLLLGGLGGSVLLRLGGLNDDGLIWAVKVHGNSSSSEKREE